MIRINDFEKFTINKKPLKFGSFVICIYICLKIVQHSKSSLPSSVSLACYFSPCFHCFQEVDLDFKYMFRIIRTNKHFLPHHRYQLEIVLLFACGVFLLVPFYLLIDMYGLERHTWQWAFFWPWMLIYVGYSLKFRNSIPKQEHIAPLKRPIIHWVLFGLILIFFHIDQAQLTTLYSLDLAFLVFTLFLADSYWDFKS